MIIRATPAQAGCWIDGANHGWRVSAAGIRLAWAAGMDHSDDDDIIVTVFTDGGIRQLSTGEYVSDDGRADSLCAGEHVNDMCNEATEWLSLNVAPEGYYFEWDGDLLMVADEDED